VHQFESKAAYYADFGVYAVLVVALTIAGLHAPWPQQAQWLGAAAAGACAWTLIEYLLHRFVFHGVPFISGFHELHHRSPRAYLGTPTWLSLAILAGVFLIPLWRATSMSIACGTIAGIAGGFLWYGIVHHVIHHRRPRRLAVLLKGAAHRHRRHHYSGEVGNFGVSTQLWDLVFRTGLCSEAASRSAAHSRIGRPQVRPST
jgi:sterol desaturase/sphingolipid hydroxylase (fatty acid hydroxylase superfamily)